MNRKISFLLCFCFFLFGNGFLFAKSAGNAVEDSLKNIYVSVVPVGNNFIVNQGKWLALFDNKGMPLTDFKYRSMQAGLDGKVIAEDGSGYYLLDTIGNLLFKFNGNVNYTDTIHRLYRYIDIYEQNRGKPTGTVYDESGKVILQYFQKKSYPLGFCQFSINKIGGYLQGVKDTLGHVVLDAIYTKTSISDWGLAGLKEDTVYVFNKKGDLRFRSPGQNCQMLRYGVLAIQMDGLWCLKDSTGKSLTPFKYYKIEELNGGNFLDAGEYVLDYQGNEVAQPGTHSSFYYEQGWYSMSFTNLAGDQIFDEDFNLIFDAGEYEEIDFLGDRFIQLKREYNDMQSFFYDRKKRKFSNFNLEKELPGNAYLLAANGLAHRYIFKNGKIRKLPYFSSIEVDEHTSFLLLRTAPQKNQSQYNESGIMPVASLIIKKNEKEYPFGLLDTNLRIILPIKYSSIEVLGTQLIAAWDNIQNQTYLFSGLGKKLLTITGYANIQSRDLIISISSEHNYWITDTLGQVLSHSKYPPVLLYPDQKEQFHSVLPKLFLQMDSLGSYGLYGLNDSILLPHEYSLEKQKMEGIYALKKKDSIYFVNHSGKLLYDGRGFQGNDYHILKSYAVLLKNKEGKWGVIDVDGNEMLPFEFDTAKTINGLNYFIGKDKNFALLNDFGQLRYPLQSWIPKWWGIDNKYYQSPSLAFYELKDRQLIPLKTIPEQIKNYFLDFSYHSALRLEKENPLGLPSGIYNRQLQRIAPIYAHYNNIISGNKITISDSLRENLALIDSNGNIVIPFFPMPYQIRIGDSMLFAIYKSGKAIYYREINGKYTPTSVWIDTLYNKNKTPSLYVVDNNGLMFNQKNGSKGLIDNNGRILWDSLITEIISDEYGYRIKRAGKWGIAYFNMRFVQAPTADSIAEYKGKYFIFEKGLEGFLDANSRVYISPKYEAILEISSLRNHFVAVKQNGKYALIDLSGKILVAGFDSIRPYQSIVYVVGYKNDTAFSFSINEDGSLQKQQIKQFIKKGYKGNIRNIVITRHEEYWGIYNNTSYEYILPEKYDAIEDLGNYFVAWKYKPDKHQGIDSTIIIDSKGTIVVKYNGFYNPKQEGNYLYVNGKGETPVFKNDKIIIPKEFKIKKLIDDNLFIVTKGDQTGIISKEGHWLLPLFKGQIDDDNLRDYDYLLAEVISEKSSKNKKYFLINSEGKRKDQKLYDAISFEENGSIIYKKGKKTGFLKEADESIEE